MRQKIFAIMGATGNIGHFVAEELLKRGHTVRALGRDEKKLHHLELKGAVPIHLDFENAEALTEAFKDAYAVFSFIPPAHFYENFADYQDVVSQAIIQAIQDAGIKRVVNLSSVGADLPDGTGPIKGLHVHEKRLDALPFLTTLVQLRPNFFMENLNGLIPMIESQGELRTPLLGDLPIPMCATRDIAWKAADFLDDTAPHPHLIFDFVGPKDVTMEYAAEVFSKFLDQSVKYVQISYSDARNALIASGMPAKSADMFIEMYDAFNARSIKPTQEIKPTHRGTTSLEEYISMVVHRLYAHVRP